MAGVACPFQTCRRYRNCRYHRAHSAHAASWRLFEIPSRDACATVDRWSAQRQDPQSPVNCSLNSSSQEHQTASTTSLVALQERAAKHAAPSKLGVGSTRTRRKDMRGSSRLLARTRYDVRICSKPAGRRKSATPIWYGPSMIGWSICIEARTRLRLSARRVEPSRCCVYGELLGTERSDCYR
jgi:hypothetical protein